MADLIFDELRLFGICLAVGAMIALIYDLVRIIRLLIPHRDFMVDIEDLAFWMFTAWLVFRTLFTYNRGSLRAYAFLGMFLGVIIYGLTFSKIVMFMVRKIVPYWKGFISFLCRPVKKFQNSLRKMLKNMATQVTIAIKGR